MKQKRIIIIHGWEGSPKREWFPWIRKELEKRDFNIIIPEMPNPEEPRIKEWVNHISSIVEDSDENTYFIGHSIGCQAILRYLESLDNKKIGGIIFVAGFFKLTNLETEEEEEIANPWLETPIDFNKVKKATNNITAIFSDNDSFVPLEVNKKIFEEKLEAKIIIEQNKGHFNEDSGIFEIPVVLKILLDYIGE
ncbi:MAG: alpha/beta hydrolase [Patescibacteria group bacterium]